LLDHSRGIPDDDDDAVKPLSKPTIVTLEGVAQSQ
jgi:hypothetical protein